MFAIVEVTSLCEFKQKIIIVCNSDYDMELWKMLHPSEEFRYHGNVFLNTAHSHDALRVM